MARTCISTHTVAGPGPRRGYLRGNSAGGTGRLPRLLRAGGAAQRPGAGRRRAGGARASGRTLPLSDTPLTLIGGSPQQVTDAQRDLARIGIEPIAGATPGTPRGTVPPRASYPVSDFAGLAAVRRRQPVTVLDVRRRLEWSASHIEGAPHIPLHYLPGRLADLPPGPIWVHCQAGYPASD